MAKNLDTTKEVVLKLLEKVEQTRNDDMYLIWLIFQMKTGITCNYEDFAKMGSFEAPRRVRAHIQNVEKKFKPTDENVLKRRGQDGTEQEDWRETFRN